MTPLFRSLALALAVAAPAAWGQGQCEAPLAARDWSRVDAHARAAQPRDERSLHELARYLKRGTRNEAERARAAFVWTADRIAYDVEALRAIQERRRRASQSPDSVFARRSGVCEGYARVYVDLVRRMGLRAEYVSGWGLSPDGKVAIGPDQLHGWAAVEVGRTWILADPTWSSGFLQGGRFVRHFDPQWFSPAPDGFALSHVPIQEQWQLVEEPISLAQAVAREAPPPECRATPDVAVSRRNARTSRVVASDDGPAWALVGGVRYRLLSGKTIPARRRSEISVEVDGAHRVALFEQGVQVARMRQVGSVWRGRLRPNSNGVTVGVQPGPREAWRMVETIRVASL